ncbi:hypothetical protein GIB67_040452 [Kingdonia uniflora]|uniref:IMS import disulfide relay-system CHCH-CHCH-like Cx9C domain-containing protein n=1 Tax=Kingdonia uniflora TaxID=39325 RepID=A0A7J7L5A4_9MAGN|nr:hypothetical protein GIB67_040452 [Kingdonia uniflora]
MGRKAAGLYINSKKLGGNIRQPCMKEMISFLNCLSLNQHNAEKCGQMKDVLVSCMDNQAKQAKNPWGSINYHLQRLSRVAKK